MAIKYLYTSISDELAIYDLKSISFFSILHRSCITLFVFFCIFYINFTDLSKILVNSSVLYKVLGIYIINFILYFILYLYLYFVLLHFLYVTRAIIQRMGYILNEKQIYNSTLVFFLVILILALLLILNI